MLNDLRSVYGRAGRYALLCPVLFAVPAIVEMIQHAAEIRLGFYDGWTTMKAVEGHPLRMILGHLKVFTLFLTGYWAMRFWAFGDDPVAARTLDPRAVRLFVPVMAWALFWLVVVQDGPMLAEALGAPARPVAFALLSLMVAAFAFEVCLAGWKVAAVVGDPAIGFVHSIRLTRGSYWWALGLSFAAVLPPMALHYAVAVLAIGKPEAVAWSLMAIDSVLVAYLGAVMTAVNYRIAERVSQRGGIALLPRHGEAAEGMALAS